MGRPRHPRRLVRALVIASGVGSLIGGSLWAVSQAAASPTASGPALPALAKGVVKGVCTGQTSSVGGLAITCGGQGGSQVGYTAFVLPSSVANQETVEVFAFHVTKTQDSSSPTIAGFDAGTSSSAVYMAVKGQGANPNASVVLSADREGTAPDISELTDTAVHPSGSDLVMSLQADVASGTTG